MNSSLKSTLNRSIVGNPERQVCLADRLERLESVFDIGVAADHTCASSNYFENLYPNKERVTALSDQSACWLEKSYPGRVLCKATLHPAVHRQLVRLESFVRCGSGRPEVHISHYIQPLASLRVSCRPTVFTMTAGFICASIFGFYTYAQMINDGELSLLSRQDINEMCKESEGGTFTVETVNPPGFHQINIKASKS